MMSRKKNRTTGIPKVVPPEDQAYTQGYLEGYRAGLAEGRVQGEQKEIAHFNKHVPHLDESKKAVIGWFGVISRINQVTQFSGGSASITAINQEYEILSVKLAEATMQYINTLNHLRDWQGNKAVDQVINTIKMITSEYQDGIQAALTENSYEQLKALFRDEADDNIFFLRELTRLGRPADQAPIIEHILMLAEPYKAEGVTWNEVAIKVFDDLKNKVSRSPEDQQALEKLDSIDYEKRGEFLRKERSKRRSKSVAKSSETGNFPVLRPKQ